MPQSRIPVHRSVVVRLIVSLVLGGLLISSGVTMLEIRRHEKAMQLEATHRILLTVRNIQNEIRAVIDGRMRASPVDAVKALIHDPLIQAARIRVSGQTVLALGDWPTPEPVDTLLWPLSDRGMATGEEIDLHRHTLVQAPFTYRDYQAKVELLIDGPVAAQQARVNGLNVVVGHWLFLGLMTLMGLILLRRWFAGPLSEVMRLIEAQAGPRPFHRLATEGRCEFAMLARGIGDMLTRLESTAERLRTRERAFESLYQLAPTAMIGLAPNGIIVEANRRASELLLVSSEDDFIGLSVFELVVPEDRDLLLQTIDRLEMDPAPRSEIRLQSGGRILHVAVDCTGVRDETGAIQSVRLSLWDISHARKLQAELEDKGRLLNLIIDHMSDGILLVDAQRRVAACNRRLASLLHSRTETLVGQSYEAGQFWEELGMVEPRLFVSRLQQIESDLGRPAQERFEARSGTFLFQGIPVHDNAGNSVGRLWVVQEITSQVQGQKLLIQQTEQLQALRQLGQDLLPVTNHEAFLQCAATHLFEAFGVEAVGIALRRAEGQRRSQQILHRGGTSQLLEANAQLVDVVERQLMPQVMSQNEVTFWADVPRSTVWGKVFHRAGLTCLAGGPLMGLHGPVGVLWIARRGGEHLERQHIFLLEAVLPLLGSRVEIASLFQSMDASDMADSVTGLATARQLRLDLARHAKDPQTPCGLALVSLEHYQTLAEAMNAADMDDLLRQVAVAISRVVRRSCRVARISDRQFAIMCPGSLPQDLDAMANRLHDAVGSVEAAFSDAHTWHLTARIDLAHYPRDVDEPQDLLPRVQHAAAPISAVA